MDLSGYDHLQAYCPMLGHGVPFSYCRGPGSETPCSRIIGCREGMVPPEILNRLAVEAAAQPKKSRMDLILRALEMAANR